MTQPARKPSGWLHGTAETYSKKGEFDENLVSYRRPDFCGRDPLCGRRPHLSTADGTRRAERPALARRRRAQDLADSGFREDRKSVVEGKRGSVRVDVGGGRYIKKKNRRKKN